ncbi:MAG TPA: TonB-dependent receptor [Candidatus Methylomirabilis sp.]|nr:TonB-dependent receptor [Candidatus Methylomirabilis sp.]
MPDNGMLSTSQKALAVNLDPKSYGTFAEIGGGQEVARWFFHVGGAAGTVAKTISAYDMAVSDSLYGPAERYVSRQRLEAMLAHEFRELATGLDAGRGERTTFFAFGDTVATQSYRHPGPGRGWVGIRFQARPREAPSEILVHLHLRDSSAVHQQEALGLFGVNLVHAAFFHRDEPASLVRALVEELPRSRVEIDMLKVAGPAFPGVDNRLVSLQLVEQGLTDAAMFRAGGDVIQPSEVLHKQPILVERGSFRPATKLTLDLLERARDQFRQEPEVHGQAPVVLAEMTLRNLLAGGDADHADFLARAEVVGALGFDVLISRFQPYYELAEYLTAYTDGLIGLAVGLPSVRQIADEQYYTHLPGGVLESMGRLFKRSVKMYVYPALDPATGRVFSVERAPVPAPWHHLRDLLLEIKRLEPIRNYNESYLSIHTPDVLARIEHGDPSWEGMVPPAVASLIKRKGLFRRNAPQAALTS